MSHAQVWVKLLSCAVPGDIRPRFREDLLETRRALREQGLSRIRIEAACFRELINGIAQHMPLRPLSSGVSPRPQLAERCARVGWVAWRMVGVALLAGFAVPHLIAYAGVLMALTLACVVTITLTAPLELSPQQRRCVTSVLGGVFASLIMLALYAVSVFATVGLLAAALQSRFLATAAVYTVGISAALTFCWITASGWIPQPWEQRRAVRAVRA